MRGTTSLQHDHQLHGPWEPLAPRIQPDRRIFAWSRASLHGVGPRHLQVPNR
jgi:hypothetical protein